MKQAFFIRRNVLYLATALNLTKWIYFCSNNGFSILILMPDISWWALKGSIQISEKILVRILPIAENRNYQVVLDSWSWFIKTLVERYLVFEKTGSSRKKISIDRQYSLQTNSRFFVQSPAQIFLFFIDAWLRST